MDVSDDGQSQSELSDDAIEELILQDELVLVERDEEAARDTGAEPVVVAIDAAVDDVLVDLPADAGVPLAPTVDDLMLYPSGRVYEYGARMVGSIIRGSPEAVAP